MPNQNRSLPRGANRAERAALAKAHRALAASKSLDEMLQHPGSTLILKLLARRYLQRGRQRQHRCG